MDLIMGVTSLSWSGNLEARYCGRLAGTREKSPLAPVRITLVAPRQFLERYRAIPLKAAG
jgi:hypothetical protein